jgi:hypothetical protein
MKTNVSQTHTEEQLSTALLRIVKISYSLIYIYYVYVYKWNKNFSSVLILHSSTRRYPELHSLPHTTNQYHENSSYLQNWIINNN